MPFHFSDILLADMNNALRTALNGGYVFVFAGAAPASPQDALNMATTHTQMLRVSLNGTATGITLQVSTNDTIVKTTAEVWSGLVAFDGFQSALTTLTPTFFRFCGLGDDGRSASTALRRIQGTVGGPASSADLIFGSDTLTRNGVNTESIGAFRHVLRRQS
ncbi:MAG: hypothetical protein DDT39_00048 [Firmicutes bacterium]|nr:hypothetical protein [candidate division NPL-UPA2 bacterium]